MSITLLNTGLKILTKVLANSLRLVKESDWNWAELRSITICIWFTRFHCRLPYFLESIKDNTEAGLINLDQFKTFEWVDHRFLVAVLETAKFKLDFTRRISILYQSPTAVIQVNEKCPEFFQVEQTLCSHFGSPASEKANQNLSGIRQSWRLRVKFSITLPCLCLII